MVLVVVANADNEREAEWDCRATKGGSSNLHVIILVSGQRTLSLLFCGRCESVCAYIRSAESLRSTGTLEVIGCKCATWFVMCTLVISVLCL